MKQPKKYIDISVTRLQDGRVIDLRKTKSNIKKDVDDKKVSKNPSTQKPKPFSKNKDKIYLIANEETKFNDSSSNIDVNFLRDNSQENNKQSTKGHIFKNFKKIKLNIFKGIFFGKYNKIVFSKSLIFFLIIALCSVSTIRVLAFFQEDLLSKKDRIISRAEIGYKYMDSGQESILQKDYDLASYKFGVASERFTEASKELDIIGQTVIDSLSLFPGGKQVASADYLLEAGSNIAVASGYIANALAPFSQTEGVLESINDQVPQDKDKENLITFTDALLITNSNLEKALVKIRLAEDNLNNVKEDSLPGDIAEKVKKIKGQVPQIRFILEKYLSFSDLILELLGHDNMKKYLFLFQNSREMRATGGFIGTYGEFDIDAGKVKNIKIEGPYNVDGQLFDNIAAPEPMRLIVSRMYMRDANWFADFSTSAQKVSSLYEKSGQATTDGVIAVTSNFFNDLLELVGPIDMPEYGKTINYENFYEETQKQVEYDYDKEENRPKQFIADMFPKLIDKFSQLDQENWPDILNLVIDSFEQKDIMIYFKDQELESIVNDYGWGGEIVDTQRDYLNVVSTNIGGGKTDHVVKQEVYLDTDIKSDGSVINTLTISRKHQGDINKLFEGLKNVSYLRFYVPLGSTLLEAEGFDDWFFDIIQDPQEGYVADPLINEIESGMDIFGESNTRIFKESGKTVFGNWMGVEVGSEKVARIKYKLPFRIKIDEQNPIKNYSLILQKQPGATDRHLYGKISFPDLWKKIWEYKSSDISMDNIEYYSNMNKDSVLGLIFAGKNFNL